MRIIVADDMPVQARQTADAVRRTFPGWEVLTAGGGQEVLRLLRQAPTDIVLSDIRMPGMDGLEMLHEMRQLSPKTRVVFITAYPLFEYAQKALKLGATDLLLKPVDPDALTDLLSRLGGGTAGVADRDLRLWLDCPWNMLDEGIRRRISEQYPRGCVCAVCIPSGGTDVPSAARLAGMLGRELGCRLQALERREASGQLTCALVCPQTEEICRRLGGSLRTAALRYGFRAGISAFSSHLPREGRTLFTEAMRGADRAFYESAGVSACDHADAAPAPEVPSAASRHEQYSLKNTTRSSADPAGTVSGASGPRSMAPHSSRDLCVCAISSAGSGRVLSAAARNAVSGSCQSPGPLRNQDSSFAALGTSGAGAAPV